MSSSKGGRSSSTSSTQTTNTSTPTSVQDSSGITVAGIGGGVSIVNTDMNAFENATALAQRSLDVGNALAGDALALSRALAGASIDTVATVQTESLTALSSGFSGALNTVTNFVKDLQGAASKQIGDTTAAIASIGRSLNTSTDARVAEISGNAIKYVVIGVAGVAALAVAYQVFKK